LSLLGRTGDAQERRHLSESILPAIPELRHAHAHPDPERDPLKVLFIAGAGRSGSTLIERLMGQFDGFVSLGEMSWIFEVGVQRNYLCGCGLPYHECPLWVKVFDEAFGGMDNIDADKMRDFWALNHAFRGPNGLGHLHARGRAELAEKAADCVAVIEALYLAVQRVTGARVIVDTSKSLLTPILMRNSQVVDLHVALLVRDPRAIAFSWATPKPDPTRGPDAIQDKKSVLNSALWWLASYVTGDAVRQEGNPPSMLLRYEDFTEDPAEYLRQLAALVGETVDPTALFNDDSIELVETHSVWGNPMRFAGRVVIRRDDRWKTDLPARDRRFVEALTLPYLRRFGYRPGIQRP